MGNFKVERWPPDESPTDRQVAERGEKWGNGGNA